MKRRCNVCHEIANYCLFETILDKDGYQRDILICPSCSVLYNPTLEERNLTPSEVAELQGSAVQGVYHISKDDFAQIERRISESEPILSFLFSQNDIPLNRNVYLEIGGGAGYLAAAATKFFSKVFTIELDSREIEKTFKAVNAPHARIVNSFSDFVREGIGADLAVLWHTLEHIEYPLDFLFDLKRTLNNHGVLYFQVPLYRKANVFPSHFWFFNARTAEILREKLAFKNQKVVFDTTNDFMTVICW